MGVLNEHPQSRIQNFSVETVRNLLNLDNKGIAKLCAKVSLMPKKDMHGRTFFTKDDVEILRRVKGLSEQQKTVKRSSEPARASKSYASVPMKKASSSTASVPALPQPQKKSQASAAAAIDRICTSLASMENNLLGKISKLVDEKLGAKLDEKLDGMDEVVVELVRCKTENETLRYKMNELNKEVYNLKNELSKYKPFGFGLYVKKNGESNLL